MTAGRKRRSELFSTFPDRPPSVNLVDASGASHYGYAANGALLITGGPWRNVLMIQLARVLNVRKLVAADVRRRRIDHIEWKSASLCRAATVLRTRSAGKLKLKDT